MDGEMGMRRRSRKEERRETTIAKGREKENYKPKCYQDVKTGAKKSGLLI
jgi:hypothetical protein